MSELSIRRLLQVALVLALLVVVASSYLRLAGNGLACEPWPACYGTAASATQANQATPEQLIRMAHRVAASVFLVVILLVIALAWRAWSRVQRGLGLSLLATTLVLAVVGRFTPSPLPSITWINVLGGFLLVSLLVSLLQAAPESPPRPRAVLLVLLAVLTVQVLAGTLLSSRLAAAECMPVCAHPPGGDLIALWNPLQTGSAVAVAGDAGAASLLHALHRIGGLVLVLAALAWTAHATPRQRAGSVAWAAIAVLALGFALTHRAGPAVGAAHALAAALLIAGLAQSLRPHVRTGIRKE